MKIHKEIEALFGDTGFALPGNIHRIIDKKNQPVTVALLKELVGLMHKYGIYWNPEAGIADPKDPDEGLFGMSLAIYRGRMDLSDPLEQTKAGLDPVIIERPNAHQTLAATALRKSIQDAAEGGAE